MPSSIHITIAHISKEFSIDELDELAWNGAPESLISTYWSGQVAVAKGQLTVKLLWSDTSLYVRFGASQGELLIGNEQPDVTKKVVGLWERDVCEIFIAPDRGDPRRYFEFEVAPTGEWLDLAIDLTSGERVTDWDYKSQMEAAACIEDGKVTMAIKIPWEAFGRRPKAGDVWLGNIFRCVGKEPDRGYLAWQPTMTDKPNFHVPEAFGELHFVE